MGKRGPKKTPAPIKKRRGTYRPDRDGGPAVEQAAQKQTAQKKMRLPPAPSFLSKAAVDLWKSLGPQLCEAGLLTDSEILAFSLLCQAWGDWQEAIATIVKEGLICEGSGNPYQHPAVGIRNRSWLNIMKGCQEFGLTPSSRSGPQVLKWNDDTGDADPETAKILGIN